MGRVWEDQQRWSSALGLARTERHYRHQACRRKGEHTEGVSTRRGQAQSDDEHGKSKVVPGKG